MPKFRADYDVKSTVVLAEGCPPLTLQGEDFEIVLRNAKLDARGHAPGLDVQVIASSDSIETVATDFRELLAKQLDILTFVTHSTFIIEQCRRVIEWEPFKKSRAFKALQRFDPLYPPDPEFPVECIETTQAIMRANPPGHVRRALQCFRLGVLLRQPEEQFQQFWLAIETLAEGSKEPVRVPIACPKCSGPLTCEACHEVPTRRPMAQQAIRDLVEKIIRSEPEKSYRRLYNARNHLMHGRSNKSIEKDCGRPLFALVNEAAYIAWHAIFHLTPGLEGEFRFAHRDGDFANVELIVGPFGEFIHTGEGEHPTDDKIPNINIELITRFGWREE